MMIERRDWNLILMLDLRCFNRWGEPMELETPCFWYQKLVTRKLDRVSWALVHKRSYCLLQLQLLFYCIGVYSCFGELNHNDNRLGQKSTAKPKSMW